MLLAILFACQNAQAPPEEHPVEEVVVEQAKPNSVTTEALQTVPPAVAVIEDNNAPSETEPEPKENPLQETLTEDSVLEGTETLEIENSPQTDALPNVEEATPPPSVSGVEPNNTTQITDQTENNVGQDNNDEAETVDTEPSETVIPEEDESPKGEQTEGLTNPEGTPSTNNTSTPESLILTQPAIYATTYRFHSSNSQLVVQVFKEPNTVGASMSHDHVILARTWTGSIRWHSEDPKQCVFEFRVPVNALDPDPPKLRAKYGLEGSLTQSQREDIKENMLSSDQLDSEKYPNITFQAFSCEKSLESFIIKGLLNIRGVERSVRFKMDIVLNEGFHAKGSFFVHHQDFDFEPYSALLGAIQNQEDIKISFDLHSLQLTP